MSEGHRAAALRAALRPLRRLFPEANLLLAPEWPLESPQLPAVLLHAGDQDLADATSGAGVPTFSVSMPVIARARAIVRVPPGDLPRGEAHGLAIESAAGALGEALKEALLAEADFVALFDGIGPARLERRVDASGESVLLEVALSLTCRWSEAFNPRLDTAFTGLDLRLDAIEPADRLGTYPPVAPFPPAAPAPRQAGPDGRAEAGFSLDLPT